MLILRNDNVAPHCRLFSPNVTCKIREFMSYDAVVFSSCYMSLRSGRMSNLTNGHVALLI